MTRCARNAAAIRGVHALLPCTVNRAYCIPLFIIFDTFNPFRSNLSEVVHRFVPPEETRSGVSGSTVLYKLSCHLETVWHVSAYATITASLQPQNAIDKRPGIGSALTVTCWMETPHHSSNGLSCRCGLPSSNVPCLVIPQHLHWPSQ